MLIFGILVFGRDAVVLGEGSGKRALEGKCENMNNVIHKLGENAEDLGKAHSQARSSVVRGACCLPPRRRCFCSVARILLGLFTEIRRYGHAG